MSFFLSGAEGREEGREEGKGRGKGREGKGRKGKETEGNGREGSMDFDETACCVYIEHMFCKSESERFFSKVQ